MAIFEGIKYEYYDEHNNLLGVSSGFLGGLTNNPNTCYVNKLINGEFKKTITIYISENEEIKTY